MVAGSSSLHLHDHVGQFDSVSCDSATSAVAGAGETLTSGANAPGTVAGGTVAAGVGAGGVTRNISSAHMRHTQPQPFRRCRPTKKTSRPAGMQRRPSDSGGCQPPADVVTMSTRQMAATGKAKHQNTVPANVMSSVVETAV